MEDFEKVEAAQEQNTVKLYERKKVVTAAGATIYLDGRAAEQETNSRIKDDLLNSWNGKDNRDTVLWNELGSQETGSAADDQQAGETAEAEAPEQEYTLLDLAADIAAYKEHAKKNWLNTVKEYGGSVAAARAVPALEAVELAERAEKALAFLLADTKSINLDKLEE